MRHPKHPPRGMYGMDECAEVDLVTRAEFDVAVGELLDAYFDEVGFLDEHGVPQPAAKLYFAAVNSARVAVVDSPSISERNDSAPIRSRCWRRPAGRSSSSVPRRMGKTSSAPRPP